MVRGRPAPKHERFPCREGGCLRERGHLALAINHACDMKDEEAERLFDACRKTLADWIDILRVKAGNGFPGTTAFHGEMAAHGKYRQPCPVCGAPIQRIVRAE